MRDDHATADFSIVNSGELDDSAIEALAGLLIELDEPRNKKPPSAAQGTQGLVSTGRQLTRKSATSEGSNVFYTDGTTT